MSTEDKCRGVIRCPRTTEEEMRTSSDQNRKPNKEPNIENKDFTEQTSAETCANIQTKKRYSV